MGEPKVQTFRTTRVDSAVPGSEIQPCPWTPTRARASLTRPLVPNIARHSTAIATLPPISDGR